MNKIARITSKGQVTIPKEIRERLGLEKGKEVLFEVEGQRTLMYPLSSDPLSELKKMRNEVKFSRQEIEQMKKSAGEAWEKFN